ncbi:MAG: aminopeptidase [Planctomycetota bacterium]
MSQMFRLSFCVVGLFFLSYCGPLGCSFGYLIDLGAGQLQVLTNQVPLEDVFQDPKISETQKEKIRLVVQAKKFGEIALGFTPNNNYTSFYDTQGKAVSYNVCACAPDCFESKIWWFPIVGEIPYLGYFELESALKKSKQLKAEGYDVLVSEVSAYSTLGWFSDPIFSAMLERSSTELINLILHESTHAYIYLPNESNFNETLANFVADKGTELFLQQFSKNEWEAQYQQERTEKEHYMNFLNSIYEQLKNLYAGEFPQEDTLKWKKYILETAAQEYRSLKKYTLKSDDYIEEFPVDRINNAYFSIFRTYHQDIPVFEQLYNAQGKDLKKMLVFLKELKFSQDPFDEIRFWLNGSAPP